MLRGLRTCGFHVADLAAAKAWYTRLLGFGPYFDQPFYVGFDVGGYELGLLPADDGDGPDRPGVGGDVCYWAVDDVHGALERVFAMGARPNHEARDVGEGIVVASVIDPFGNVLGLITNPVFRPEGRLHDEDASIGAGLGDVSERAIVAERVVPASPEALWPLWTTTEGITSWLVSEARVELAVGGPFEVCFASDAPVGSRGSEGCRVLSFIPGRMLSFTWNAPPHLDRVRKQHTWVVVELKPVEAGTRVRITHCGWPASGWSSEEQWPAAWAYFEAAWPRLLGALASHLGA